MWVYRHIYKLHNIHVILFSDLFHVVQKTMKTMPRLPEELNTMKPIDF